MADVKSADLPAGSVITTGYIAYLRVLDGIGAVWHGTDGSRMRDDQIDRLLQSGAIVLQEGR